MADYEEINTNRLHVAICCHLLNVRCYLFDNSYGKNKNIYDYILKY